MAGSPFAFYRLAYWAVETMVHVGRELAGTLSKGEGPWDVAKFTADTCSVPIGQGKPPPKQGFPKDAGWCHRLPVRIDTTAGVSPLVKALPSQSRSDRGRRLFAPDRAQVQPPFGSDRGQVQQS